MATRQCTMCSNLTTERCKKRKCSPYCSTACQSADWPTHKLLCKHLPHFATPPNAQSRRGIFFPVNATTPQFVRVEVDWVPPKEPDSEYDQGFQNIKHIRNYIGDNSWQILGNVIRSRERRDGDHARICMRDSATIDGSKPNRSIFHCLAEDPPFASWCRGMLAMKILANETYAHVDTIGFGDVVDAFRSYGSSVRISEMVRNKNHKGPVSPFDAVLKKEGVKQGKALVGMRMNSYGDQRPGVGMYQDVKVASDDPVWSEPIRSVSKLVGLPIRLRHIRPMVRDDENTRATFLNMDANPNSETWGWCYPWEWQRACGSVVVVHAEGKAISPEQVVVLCSFCYDFLQPLFEETHEQPEDRKVKENVLRHLTPRVFRKFNSDYMNPGQEDPEERSDEGLSEELFEGYCCRFCAQ